MSQPQDAARPERAGLFRSLVFRITLAGLITGILLAYGASFTVSEGNNAIVTRFGRPVREIREAGFYWKYPWPIEQFHAIDVRLRYFNSPFTATFTRDRKNVVLMTYVVWRVDDPLLFFQSLGTPEAAELKLDGMIAAGKNFHMGNYDLTALVSTADSAIQADKIESAILDGVKAPAREKFGIAIEQVGIKRIAYPQENMAAVLDQMRAERRAEAGELRAKGKKESQRIRDEGLVKAEQILRTGREEAGKILGKAEKEAAGVYAQAHQLDPDFYRFWRSMQVVKKVLNSKATVILRNDQEPFSELFQSARSTASQPGAPAKHQSPVPVTTSTERK
jgi:modulator of FtsH protease HflC